MKKIIPFCSLLILLSCSTTHRTSNNNDSYKMITAIGDLEKKLFSPSIFENKGLIDLKEDVEIYATQDSIAEPRESNFAIFKKRNKKSYIKLRLVNDYAIIKQLNSKSFKLSEYIFDNPGTHIITEISVYLNASDEQKIMNSNALFLNKTPEGIYRVKTVNNSGVNYVSLNQDKIFDFKSENFCLKKSQYDEKIISISTECSTQQKKKVKKTRYDKL